MHLILDLGEMEFSQFSQQEIRNNRLPRGGNRIENTKCTHGAPVSVESYRMSMGCGKIEANPSLLFQGSIFGLLGTYSPKKYP